MSAYVREGGEWVEVSYMTRDGGSWIDPLSEGWVRDGGSWVQFAPNAPADLLAPTNLQAVPGDVDAILSWTNPTQDTTPDFVQFRIPEVTTVWTELTYPATTLTVAYLTPETDYQFQVRYITRDPDDGTIDLTGPIANKFFTTLALDGPGTPAKDPGGTGGDSITNWPLPPGGGPYTVGGAGCWWEYTIQIFDYATGFSDSVLIANVEVDGDIGTLAYNFVDEGFACDDVLRWKYREVCNSVPGDWNYGVPWSVVCDYDVACGGAAQTSAFAGAPWNDVDAVFVMPKPCWNETTFKTEILDYLDPTIEYGKLPGYNLPLYIGGAWQLVAKSGLSEYGEAMVAGHVPGLVPIGSSVPALTSDFSFSAGFFLDIVPQSGSGAPVKVLEIGKTIKVYAYANGGNWTATVSVPKEGGGSFSLTSTTDLTTDEWHTVGLTIDQDGNKILYIDGVADVTDADTTRANFGDLNGDVELYGNDNMATRKVGGWGRVLTPAEMMAAHRAFLYDYPYKVDDGYEAITAASTDWDYTLATTDVRAGDVRVINWAVRDGSLTVETGLETAPAGWNTSVNGPNAIWWKVVEAGDPGLITAAWTNASETMGYVREVVYRNCEEAISINWMGVSTNSSLYYSTHHPTMGANWDSGVDYDLGYSEWWEGTTFTTMGCAGSCSPTDTAGYQTGSTADYNTPTLTGDANKYSNLFAWEGVREQANFLAGPKIRITQANFDYNLAQIILRSERTDTWLSKPQLFQMESKLIGYLSTGPTVPQPSDTQIANGMFFLCAAIDNRQEEADWADGRNSWLEVYSDNHVGGTYLSTNTWYGTATVTEMYGTYVWLDNVNLSDPVAYCQAQIKNSSFKSDPVYSQNEPTYTHISNSNQRILQWQRDRRTNTGYRATYNDDGDVTLLDSCGHYESVGAQDGECVTLFYDPGPTLGVQSLGTLETDGEAQSSSRTINNIVINPVGVTTAGTMTAPSVRSVGAHTHHSVTSRPVALPATIVAGDLLLLVFMHTSNVSSIEGGTGNWRHLGSLADQGSIDSFQIYGKIADGTESGNITVVSALAGSATSFIMALSGTTGPSYHREEVPFLNVNTLGGTWAMQQATQLTDDELCIRMARFTTNAVVGITVGTEINNGLTFSGTTNGYQVFTEEERATAGVITAADLTIAATSSKLTDDYWEGVTFFRGFPATQT